MKPLRSRQHSQKPVTCLSLEPDQSSPYPIPCPEDPFSYYPPIYSWVFQEVSFEYRVNPSNRTTLCV